MIEEKEHPMKEFKSRAKKISFALRNTFINEVFQKGSNIRKAAKKFKINYSTAKVIVSNLKKQSFGKKKRYCRYPNNGRKKRIQKEDEMGRSRCLYQEIKKKQRERLLGDKIQIVCTVGFYTK